MWPKKPTWIGGCIIVYLTLNAYVHGTSSFKEDENTAINYFRKLISPVSRTNKGEIRRSRPKKSRKTTLYLKIQNGSPAALGEIPWMAGLIFYRTDSQGKSEDWYCGGALIKPDIVLTAANVPANSKYTAVKVTVVLGSLTLGKGDTRIESTDITTHESFANKNNDIAIIRLPSPVELSQYIQLIKLPSDSQLNESFAGEIAVAAGYGYIDQVYGQDALNRPLSYRKMLVLEYNVCQTMSPLMTENLICTQVAEAKDSDKKIGNATICNHDCGGPLYVFKNNEPILIGVMVLGGCYPNQHLDLYTRVTSHIHWILNTIGDHDDNNTGTITNNTDTSTISSITNITNIRNVNNINDGQFNINIIKNVNRLKKKQKRKQG